MIFQGIARHLGLPVAYLWADYSESFAFFSTASFWGWTSSHCFSFTKLKGPQSVLWYQLQIPEYTSCFLRLLWKWGQTFWLEDSWVILLIHRVPEDIGVRQGPILNQSLGGYFQKNTVRQTVLSSLSSPAWPVWQRNRSKLSFIQKLYFESS